MSTVSISLLTSVFAIMNLAGVSLWLWYRLVNKGVALLLCLLNAAAVISLIQVVLVDLDWIPQSQWTLFLFLLIPQLTGHAFTPVLWLIFCRLREKKCRIGVHFSIWILDVFLVWASLSDAATVSETLEVLSVGGIPFPAMVYNVSFVLQLLWYSLFIFWLLRREELNGNIPKSWTWFRNFVLFVLLLYVSGVILFVVFPTHTFDWFLIQLIYTVQAFYIAYFLAVNDSGLRLLGQQFPRIYQLNRPLMEDNSMNLEPDELVFNELISGFREQKWYLKSDAKIGDIAAKLNIAPTRLSQILNSQKGVTFSDLVNEFRVEHAKNMLMSENSKSITMDAVGLESGFTSRASFYRIFKQRTGKSPLEFFQQENGGN